VRCPVRGVRHDRKLAEIVTNEVDLCYPFYPKIQKGEAVHCTLAFEPLEEARAGDVHLVQVVQTDSQRRIVGGLWVALIA